MRSAAIDKSNIQNRVAWLSLDELDNNPARFFSYFIAALQTIYPTFGAGMVEMVQSPQPPANDVVLTALLNELSNQQDKIILVLDDYHLLEAPAIDQALVFLLDHLPPQMHIVITTREDPQLPLARYRARAQLTEVRANDLRFTPAEAADFLNQVMGLKLSRDEIATLESRTEGWIAGLQLAALSMQGRSDTSTFIQAFTGDHHFILDYLVEEVLHHQPAAVRHFLLQTAILERLCGALCDAVTGQEAGTATLAALDRGNLFVVPLDDKRQWYRYHHLFSDMLQARLLAEEPETVSTLHQRASDWYAQQGLTADAIRHALAARDFVRAAGLIELAWPAMDGRFQSATWLGWARALPDAVVSKRPVLAVAFGWALLNDGELEAADAHLAVAEGWLDERAANGQSAQNEMIVVDQTQMQNLPASLATARTYQAQARGDIRGSVKYGQQALRLLPADDHLRRGPAAALLGLAQWALGDLEAAHQAISEAMANFQKAGNLHFALSGTYGMADIRVVQGRLYDAITTYKQVLQIALAQGEPPLRGSAELYLGLSELYRQQGEMENARWHLQRSEELGEEAGLPDWRYRHCRAEACFKLALGDLTGALDSLDAAERHYRRTPVPDVRPLAALKAQVWIAQGRLNQARRWVQEQGLSIDDDLSFLAEFEHLTLAQLLLAEYRHTPDEQTLAGAMHLLDRLQQAAQTGGRMGSVIEIGVLQSLGQQMQGNLSAALATLQHTLMLAEPEGYVGVFAEEGAAMAQLLSAANERGIFPRVHW